MTADEYQHRRAALITYLRVKADQCDWHGVADAACDLRVLESEYAVQSQRALGKYAPVITELNARSAE